MSKQLKYKKKLALKLLSKEGYLDEFSKSNFSWMDNYNNCVAKINLKERTNSGEFYYTVIGRDGSIISACRSEIE